MKAFFIKFQGLSVTIYVLRPEIVSLTILAIKRGTLCNFIKTLKGRHFIGHSGTRLAFLIIIDL